MAKTHGTIIVDEERCKGCELCVVFCPEEVLAMASRVNSFGYHPVFLAKEGCTGCLICAKVCPDLAIDVFREERRKAAASV